MITRSGPGTITTIGGGTDGSFADGGTIDVESGSLVIQGPFAPGSTSTLLIHVTGPVAGTQFGQLQVTGAVALTGALQLVTSPSYAPAADVHLVIAQGATRTGNFTSISGLGISGGRTWLVRLDATSVALEVQQHETGTTTTVASSANPSVSGQAVTYMATVAPSSTGAGSPSGTVSFADGASPISTCGARPINAATGVATCAVTYTGTAGSPHAITAKYSGDTTFTGSSGALGGGQTVNPAETATALTQSPNPAPFGQPISLTATINPVAPGTGTPTGTVQFTNGSANLGSPVPVAGGQAKLTLGSLPPNQTITALYSSDPNFLASQGQTIPVVSFSHPAVTGTVNGSLTLSGGTWLLSGATVRGSVTISNGAAVAIMGSAVNGSLMFNPQSTDRGGALSVCGTTVGGAVGVYRAGGMVVIGDPEDDGCAANIVSGRLMLTGNSGGDEVGGNRIRSSLALNGNSGAGAYAEDTGPEVEANSIDGSLTCFGDTPAASNGGHPNTVRGNRLGECRAPNF